MYTADIDALYGSLVYTSTLADANRWQLRYETVEASAQSVSDVEPPATWGATDVEAWLASQAADINSAHTLDPDADLFSQGFDRYTSFFFRMLALHV